MNEVKKILNNANNGIRISVEEALFIYKNASLTELGITAHSIKQKIHGNTVCFNRNMHIEPTNVCVYRCKFCSFSRDENHPESWNFSKPQIIEKIKSNIKTGITEVHIVGGVYPNRDVYWYADLLKEIKKTFPNLHIKAFTAIELFYMVQKAKLTLSEGLQILKNAGLQSIPGGGAEIFDYETRMAICPEKGDAQLWLNVHEQAHTCGIPSNATLLYGHTETINHRIEHLEILRNLQDKTQGFNAFIPLKYKNYNNELSHITELPITEDLRLFAVSRIFLDNIPNIKAYWPMTGKNLARILISFGANDLDGTISDSTKIYSMAGSEEIKPEMSLEEIINFIKNEGFNPVERDSLYHVLTHF